MKASLRDVLLALFSLICLLAIAWPGYAWFGNTIEPRVFGLPFAFVWNLIWVAASFFALLVYHLSGQDP